MVENNYQKISDVLKAIKLTEEPEVYSESPLFKDWAEAAGPMIAKNTWNLAAKGEVLQVVVNSSTWAHELINQQQSIVEKMQVLGYRKITSMSIRIQVPKPVKFRDFTRKTSEAPTVSAELRETFAQLAKESTDPKTREFFKKMSKIKPEN